MMVLIFFFYIPHMQSLSLQCKFIYFEVYKLPTMTVVFRIMLISYFVRVTITLLAENLIECVNDDRFKTSDGSYLQCQFSCQCPSDDQKEVHVSYVGCQKCCCGNIDCKLIEKVFLETNKTLEYTLQENRNLTDNNAYLKKISEDKAIALRESNKSLESALRENQNLKKIFIGKENKISALIIAITIVSFFLVVFIGTVIYIIIFENPVKNFIFQPLEYTLQENQNLTDNNANLKKISEEKAIALYESNKSFPPSNVTTDSLGLLDLKGVSLEK
ncbi:uncharacterized protein LOC136084520 isoform X2 [Hydra vulgaris]|uniref:Uncharacterized protein LOC136084520 isoform X2 n=1 Tax=Hydra vulgaris TaxID=6087 RepID=A0ABM4CG47_HYDVU